MIKKAPLKNKLQIRNPAIIKEWHPLKNGDLKPADLTSGLSRKVWWICRKGHEWEANISNRNNGRGCPYCANQKVNNENCLKTIKPSVAAQWHPEKNGSLTPKKVTAFSNKKVWWICSKGHEWEAIISNRSNGRGCPYCNNQKAGDENCLQTLKPAIAAQWHPKKNGNLTPKQVTVFSNKKIWWLCSKGHEWSATVNNRSNGHGCPYCAKQKVNDENCLQAVEPTLAEEWHPVKNGSLTPMDVTPGSGKKVWWLCSRRGHEWRETVNHRSHGRDCPYCYDRYRYRWRRR
jgi:hypothetical protein